MTQVLHFLSAEADFQSRRGAEMLAGDPADGLCAETKTIGRGGTWRSIPFALRGLRNAKCDVVHAWDYSALWAAMLANRSNIVFTAPTFPTRRQAQWVRILLRSRNILLICDSASAVRAWIATGVPADRCRLIRPAADTNCSPAQRSNSLRSELGFSDSDHVVLAVGESTIAAQHHLSVWGVSIAHVLDRNQKILLWGRGQRCRGALRLAIRLGETPLYAVAEDQVGRKLDFDELCSAADMALVTADGPVSPLPIALCMARGLPILATPSPIVSEMLEDGVCAKIVSAAARQIARGIESLRNAPEFRQKLAANAMAKARDDFATRRYLAEHRQVYANL